MSLEVQLIAPTLAAGYCISNANGGLQGFVNTIFANGSGIIQTTASLALIIISEDPPTVDQQDYEWHRLVDGVVEGIYMFVDGAWVRPHATAPSSGERRIWTGTLDALKLHDGGEDAVVGDATGPFWEEDTTFRGRFPVGVGTLPTSSDAVAVGGTGGADEVTIERTHLPDETIYVKTDITGNSGVTGDGGETVVGADYGSDPIAGSVSACDATATSGGLANCYKTRGQTEELGDGEPLSVVPPYVGVYVIKRTSRINHRGA